jgi:hypothetical protein
VSSVSGILSSEFFDRFLRQVDAGFWSFWVFVVSLGATFCP